MGQLPAAVLKAAGCIGVCTCTVPFVHVPCTCVCGWWPYLLAAATAPKGRCRRASARLLLRRGRPGVAQGCQDQRFTCIYVLLACCTNLVCINTSGCRPACLSAWGGVCTDTCADVHERMPGPWCATLRVQGSSLGGSDPWPEPAQWPASAWAARVS